MKGSRSMSDMRCNKLFDVNNNRHSISEGIFNKEAGDHKIILTEDCNKRVENRVNLHIPRFWRKKDENIQIPSREMEDKYDEFVSKLNDLTHSKLVELCKKLFREKFSLTEEINELILVNEEIKKRFREEILISESYLKKLQSDLHDTIQSLNTKSSLSIDLEAKSKNYKRKLKHAFNMIKEINRKTTQKTKGDIEIVSKSIQTMEFQQCDNVFSLRRNPGNTQNQEDMLLNEIFFKANSLNMIEHELPLF